MFLLQFGELQFLPTESWCPFI